MNRYPVNRYGNSLPGCPSSSMAGTATVDGSTRATRSCSRCSVSSVTAHSARRGNRNNQPSVVRKASKSPEPRCVRPSVRTWGKREPMAKLAIASARGGSGAGVRSSHEVLVTTWSRGIVKNKRPAWKRAVCRTERWRVFVSKPCGQQWVARPLPFAFPALGHDVSELRESPASKVSARNVCLSNRRNEAESSRVLAPSQPTTVFVNHCRTAI